MKYLLDTNVISELVAKRPNPSVVHWIDSLDPNSVYLGVITIGELRRGIEKLPASKRKETLRDWLNDDLLIRFTGHILVIDVSVMLTWGELMGRLERTGKPLSAIDSLIAALALHHNCTLVTRNEDDFKETGVTIVNPWQ
ncbi:type II toxin-antitoxin system VapC family toxin [Desulfobacterota bacterium AH_259_B03_O07]|nr:type II toxin-antitoxin system VapC family toxin [Desulfobacterota bacterium AH_259_B03_O07]